MLRTTTFEVTAACVGCGACLRTCPERAIRVRHGRLVVLPTCTACGECAEVCPVDACVEVRR
ncbi:MAG: 4Fe-4S binding protein [Egibacteraceae bacterium]